MTTLHLGVMDVPYAYDQTAAESKRNAKRPRKPGPRASTTTGEVAEILEAKYHVMETFYALHQDEIADTLMHTLVASFESLQLGSPGAAAQPFEEAVSYIEQEFKDFLSSGQMEKLGIPGVPTKAALAGVSHRFKHPYAQRGPRPSFIDSGLYQSSFKFWVD